MPIPRREFPAEVQREAFRRSGGFCEVEGCGVRLTRHKYRFDHIIPDAMGGEPTLDNCRIQCSLCDAVKTRQDQSDLAEMKRREDDHFGIRRPLRGRGFPKAPRQHSATKPLGRR